MAEIKITEMPELLPFDSYTLEGGTEPDDYLPIIDTSETTAALKNKKVAVSTLFEKYLNADDTKIEIFNSSSIATTERVTLTNAAFSVDSNNAKYIFLDPDGVDRTVSIVLFTEGDHKYIKNIGASNTITLIDMTTDNNTTPLTHILNPGKTVHIVYDDIDHHVIPLD